MFDGLPRGARCVLDRFPGFTGGFLNGFPSLFDWTLVLCTHPEGCTKQENAKNRKMFSHSSHRQFASTHHIGLIRSTTILKKEERTEANGGSVNLVCEAPLCIGYSTSGE